MSTFVPPLFSDLGKSATDLFKKNFTFAHSLTTKAKADNGLFFTTKADLSAPAGVAGTVEVVHTEPKYGSSKVELASAGSIKGETTLNKLVDGTVVTVKADNKPNGTLTAQYRQDFFAGSASYETNFCKQNIVTGSAVVGFDGLSVGGEIKFDLMGGSDVEDYNVGLQYQTADYIATVRTENKSELVNASYFATVKPGHLVGASLNSNLVGQLATQYRFNCCNTAKVSANTNGIVNASLETRLHNPRALVSLAAQFNASKGINLTPVKFGVGVTLGDY